MPPAERTLGLRRNGKEQACEPCRKGKLACDHTTPYCGRCVRRRQTAKCIYHPAPMTKPKTLPIPQNTPCATSNHTSGLHQPPHTADTAKPSALPGSLDVSQHLPDPGTWLSTEVAVTEAQVSKVADPVAAFPTHEEQRHAAGIARCLSWKTSRFKKSRRYQGPTSFTAVFSEGQSTFAEELLDIGEDDRPHPAKWPFNAQPLLGRSRPGAPSIRTNETRKALWNIPPREICNRLLETYESFHNDTMNEVMIRHSITTLWTTFGDQLSEPRTPEKLDTITEVLLKNEENPLRQAPTDGIEWLNTFMGSNLRFESLGLLFCFFGMAYHLLPDWHPLFEVPINRGRDRRQTAWRMSECADMCLKMCDCTETINELVVALLLNILVLEKNCAGDESYKIRRRHGDLVTATIAVGLHRIPEYGVNGATTAGEYIRRLFAAVYTLDKRNSSLNGTPPLLNRLYCNHQSPFELSDEELFLPESGLRQAISELDSNGWKNTSDIWNTSIHRALFLFAVIRDEILGLCLGVDVEISASRIEDLYQRCHGIYVGLPERLHYYSLDAMPKHSSGKTLFFQAILILEFLQNKFLIDRIAVARGLPNEQRLLNTALEMMKLTIMFWTERDHLMVFCSHFDWFITCYGVPSAGVLCVELLKQCKRPTESTVQFSRSDTIQKLTMFLGFLEWIRPTDGNYQLAGRLRKVVRRILDYVLEPPPSEEEVVGDDFMDVGLDQTLGLDEMDCLDWLNTVDWTQGPWMEFS